MSIWRWAEYFCDIPEQYHVTLGEGDTPLVRSRRIGPDAGLGSLYFKLESLNPTGSYKDRFGAAAISDMLADGKTRSVGGSSGNTGSAVAAYCAAAEITCEIAILEATPAGKTQQMLAYGAKVYKVRGLGVDRGISIQIEAMIKEKASKPDAKLQISAFRLSPAGMAGVQTISYELAEQATAAQQRLDHVFVPAGGGGLNLAVARGFAGLVERGQLANGPAVHCVQPVGNNTIAGPLRDGADRAVEVKCSSRISGLQVGSVLDGDEVIQACRQCGGNGYLVPDEVTWELQARLAREEGIFCEPAGAVALAGALQAARQGEVAQDDNIVCLVTGIGFKDLPSVEAMTADSACPTIEAAELLAQ